MSSYIDTVIYIPIFNLHTCMQIYISSCKHTAVHTYLHTYNRYSHRLRIHRYHRSHQKLHIERTRPRTTHKSRVHLHAISIGRRINQRQGRPPTMEDYLRRGQYRRSANEIVIYRAMERSDAIEMRPSSGDSYDYDMRLLTRAVVAEGKDVSLCVGGPQIKPSSHLRPGQSLTLKLCRCRRDLRKAKAKASGGGGQGQCQDRERDQLNGMEAQLNRNSKKRPVDSTMTNFKDLLVFYLECTSAHGLPRAARSSSVCRRVLWAGIFVFFVAYFMYQFVALLTMFYNYPIGVKIVIEQK